MKHITNKLAQFKQWILSVVIIRSYHKFDFYNTLYDRVKFSDGTELTCEKYKCLKCGKIIYGTKSMIKDKSKTELLCKKNDL